MPKRTVQSDTHGPYIQCGYIYRPQPSRRAPGPVVRTDGTLQTGTVDTTHEPGQRVTITERGTGRDLNVGDEVWYSHGDPRTWTQPGACFEPIDLDNPLAGRHIHSRSEFP